jgi:UDP-N-acetylmuramoyl-tripeptide--D-alanyl-D-alanine ligase
VIGVAGDAIQLVAGAVDAGLAPEHAKWFQTSEEAAEFLRDLLGPGDLLLVKGSRGVRMERVVEALLAKHGIAAEVGH